MVRLRQILFCRPKQHDRPRERALGRIEIRMPEHFHRWHARHVKGYWPTGVDGRAEQAEPQLNRETLNLVSHDIPRRSWRSYAPVSRLWRPTAASQHYESFASRLATARFGAGCRYCAVAGPVDRSYRARRRVRPHSQSSFNATSNAINPPPRPPTTYGPAGCVLRICSA